jgi:N-acetylglucosamine kinase-like BadF-type ATPase
VTQLFLGVDAGGTFTRALIATSRGEVVGMGRAGGSNQWSSGTSVAEVIAAAIRTALDDRDPGSVAGGVVAMAGSLTGEDATGAAAEASRSLGLPTAPDVVSDVLGAFATGTTAADGTVIVAGTGSISAVIRGRQVARTAGGHGWLLGDEGSAVWLGLHGTRAAMRALEGRDLATGLADTIPAGLGVDRESAADTVVGLIRAVHAGPPAQLGRLAPIVLEAADAGDTVAQGLADAAADHLVALVEAVFDPGGAQVIVLAGSILTKATSIRAAVRARLLERWPSTPLEEAVSGEAGAAALAIERHLGTGIEASVLARLRAGAATP